MPNKPKKPQNTIEDVKALAVEFKQIAEQVEWYATEMKKIGIPSFGFFKETVTNKYLHELKMWLAQLQAEWGRQVLIHEKTKRDAARLALGRPMRGRPKKG